MLCGILAFAPRAARPQPAADGPVPEAILRCRAALAEWKKNPDRWKNRDAESRLSQALHDLEGIDHAQLADCLLDVIEAPPCDFGHHGEFGTHYQVRELAEKDRAHAPRYLEAGAVRGRQAKALVLHLIAHWRLEQGVDFVRSCLAPGADAIPFRAVRTLRTLPGEEALQLLRRTLADPREAEFREFPCRFQRWDRLPKQVPYKYARLHPLWVVLRPAVIRISNITEIELSNPTLRFTLGAYALQVLEERAVPVTPEELAPLLDSGSLRLQQAAARYLAAYHPRRAREALRREWQSPYQRGLCADLRAQAGAPEAMRELAVLAESRDLVLRVWAVQALGDARGHEAVDALERLARDPDTFVRQAALQALRARGRPIDSLILAEDLLSWDHYVCGEAEEACRELGPAARLRVATVMAEGRPAACPEGPCPRDESTEGGEAEPEWHDEQFGGDSMTVATGEIAESDEERVRRFLELAEGLDVRALRPRAVQLLAAEKAEEPPDAVAAALLALTPEETDFDRLAAWARSGRTSLVLAGLRGLGELGGPRSAAALLNLLPTLRQARAGTGYNPAYAECVAALAASGDAACWQRFLELAPWALHGGRVADSTYEEVEDATAFAAGCVRARGPGRAEPLARLAAWLAGARESYNLTYDVAPRFWRTLFRRDPPGAERLATPRLLEGSGGDWDWACRLCLPWVGPDLLARVERRVEQERLPGALDAIYPRDPGWALGAARAWLAAEGKWDEARGESLHLLAREADARDRQLLQSRVPSAELRAEDQGLLRRFLARTESAEK